MSPLETDVNVESKLKDQQNGDKTISALTPHDTCSDNKLSAETDVSVQLNQTATAVEHVALLSACSNGRDVTLDSHTADDVAKQPVQQSNSTGTACNSGSETGSLEPIVQVVRV